MRPALVVALLLCTACAPVTAPGPSPSSAPPSATPKAVKSDTPSAASPSAVAIPAPAGFTPSRPAPGIEGEVALNRWGVWWVSTDKLSVSYDGGRTWAVFPPPPGIPADSVAVTVRRDHTVWVASGQGGAVHVFRRAEGAGAWTPVDLPPRLKQDQWNSKGFSGAFAEGADGTFGILVTAHLSMNTVESALYTSADGGRTFASPVRADGRMDSFGIATTPALLSPTDAVAVTGPGMVGVAYTTDTGKTWTRSRVEGLPQGLRTDFKGLDVVDGHLELVGETADAQAENVSYRLFESRDGGRTFQPAAAPVDGDWQRGASLGSTRWIVPYAGGSVRVSADSGVTWTMVDAPSLPRGTGSVALTSATAATAVVAAEGCETFKNNCWRRTTLYATTDGGHTWAPLP
ncbi:MAG: repeat-like domain, partial [Frankiaceae bacterium]|nr:repeat-like domain [Frankiaceae bacterium]